MNVLIDLQITDIWSTKINLCWEWVCEWLITYREAELLKSNVQKNSNSALIKLFRSSGDYSQEFFIGDQSARGQPGGNQAGSAVPGRAQDENYLFGIKVKVILLLNYKYKINY